MDNSIGIIFFLSLPSPYLMQGNICPSEDGKEVVHICEKNFVSGDIFYLNTARGVNYEGNCVCQLRAQGAAVDLELSVHEVDAACDATLYFSPPIDHMYNCADQSPPTVAGRIEPGQTVFISFFKPSPDVIADFCVKVVQTTTEVGSMGLTCTQGTLTPDASSHQTDNTQQATAISAVVVSLIVVGIFAAVVVAILLMGLVGYCRERRRVKKLHVSAAPININDHRSISSTTHQGLKDEK
ncbi:uncharacterized protein LOC124140074 [Haliotis rufescens]|uniref:uncharacterized protein LOC124140074 n=1 Tax=Haliotis rufescens TaxID=6454 RepID=UPI00201F4BF7|nr:uncharacterized protein LOC124140074 [Haliotis rufescens]